MRAASEAGVAKPATTSETAASSPSGKPTRTQSEQSEVNRPSCLGLEDRRVPPSQELRDDPQGPYRRTGRRTQVRWRHAGE